MPQKNSQHSQKSTSSTISAREVLQEERYLWMSRAFVVMVVLAIICDIILLIALANVTPVLRVQPFYLTMRAKNEQIISIERPSQEVLRSDVLKQSYVRQYLLSRFGMGADLAELDARWGTNGIVRWMSSDAVYEDFKKEYKRLRERARDDNLTRNVRIVRLNRTGQTDDADVYTAVVKISSVNRASSVAEVDWWKVVLAVGFYPDESALSWADRLKNPLGFKVMRYGQQQTEAEKE